MGYVEGSGVPVLYIGRRVPKGYIYICMYVYVCVCTHTHTHVKRNACEQLLYKKRAGLQAVVSTYSTSE
jgi:hypothetical protein